MWNAHFWNNKDDEGNLDYSLFVDCFLHLETDPITQSQVDNLITLIHSPRNLGDIMKLFTSSDLLKSQVASLFILHSVLACRHPYSSRLAFLFVESLKPLEASNVAVAEYIFASHTSRTRQWRKDKTATREDRDVWIALKNYVRNHQ